MHFLDVEHGADVSSVATGHTDTVQALSWNWEVRLKRCIVCYLQQAHVAAICRDHNLSHQEKIAP